MEYEAKLFKKAIPYHCRVYHIFSIVEKLDRPGSGSVVLNIVFLYPSGFTSGISSVLKYSLKRSSLNICKITGEFAQVSLVVVRLRYTGKKKTLQTLICKACVSGEAGI